MKKAVLKRAQCLCKAQLSEGQMDKRGGSGCSSDASFMGLFGLKHGSGVSGELSTQLPRHIWLTFMLLLEDEIPHGFFCCTR